MAPKFFAFSTSDGKAFWCAVGWDCAEDLLPSSWVWIIDVVRPLSACLHDSAHTTTRCHRRPLTGLLCTFILDVLLYCYIVIDMKPRLYIGGSKSVEDPFKATVENRHHQSSFPPWYRLNWLHVLVERRCRIDVYMSNKLVKTFKSLRWWIVLLPYYVVCLKSLGPRWFEDRASKRVYATLTLTFWQRPKVGENVRAWTGNRPKSLALHYFDRWS